MQTNVDDRDERTQTSERTTVVVRICENTIGLFYSNTSNTSVHVIGLHTETQLR